MTGKTQPSHNTDDTDNTNNAPHDPHVQKGQNGGKPPQKPKGNFLLPAFLAAALGFSLFNISSQNDARNDPHNGGTISYSDFIERAEGGQIRDVLIQGQVMRGQRADGTYFMTYVPNYENPVNRLKDHGVNITAQPVPQPSALSSVLWTFGPIALLIGFYVWMMRRQAGAAGGLLNKIGGSKAKLLTEHEDKVTFADVAGIDEAKAELQEIVDYLKDPTKYERLGGKMPRGVLLIGSPGTGKTLTAKAVAGEAGVPFFSISGSDFVEMFVGVGASRVRDMFREAKANAPCIIFIDEIDAVGRSRGAGFGGGNDEREQTLNQLLVEMDGFEGNQNVVIIAATNRPDVLDSALKRPGRFDRQVTVPLPDVMGREAILKVHTRKIPLAHDVDLAVVARGTPGFSGADLANLANEAALTAARMNGTQVTMADFESAKDKIMLGSERRTLAMSEDEKKLTAYHEAGHALIASHMPASDPIHKATIIPRGQALGMVMRLPERDRVSMSRAKLEADLAVAAGGRLAEELIFGHDNVTTGASSDIHMMTLIAKKMVTEWGLSDKAGMLRYKEQNAGGFPEPRDISEDTAKMVDEEVRKIVDKAYETGKKILTENIDQLHSLAQALMTHETLNGADIKMVLNGETLPPRILRTPAPQQDTTTANDNNGQTASLDQDHRIAPRDDQPPSPDSKNTLGTPDTPPLTEEQKRLLGVDGGGGRYRRSSVPSVPRTAKPDDSKETNGQKPPKPPRP